ncbi:hypothetical protein CYMTET_55664 [Cymbomonas tetramitiformis]|uniref:Uncharacterized protein n=1 Tax=Cymbomonas tetramitiformis TaxID=36881 RepID=A0AAE0BCH9_9CHLO|nr:hypothetical protein CYMTET_55664 [Cymbomonas tetramitiformis]
MEGTLSMGVVVDGVYALGEGDMEVVEAPTVAAPPEDIEQYMVLPQQGVAIRLYDSDIIVWDSQYAHSISEPLLEGVPITFKERGDKSNTHTPPTQGKVLRLRGGAVVAIIAAAAAAVAVVAVVVVAVVAVVVVVVVVVVASVVVVVAAVVAARYGRERHLASSRPRLET